MKKKNNNLTPFIFLFVFILICMILVNLQGSVVNKLTIDEFTNYLETNQITELEIITKVRSENYEVTGKIKDYEENENRYPKGTSKDYTEQVNQEYQKALPILAKYGIKPEDFGGRENEYGGFEDNSREILSFFNF